MLNRPSCFHSKSCQETEVVGRKRRPRRKVFFYGDTVDHHPIVDRDRPRPSAKDSTHFRRKSLIHLSSIVDFFVHFIYRTLRPNKKERKKEGGRGLGGGRSWTNWLDLEFSATRRIKVSYLRSCAYLSTVFFLSLSRPCVDAIDTERPPVTWLFK